MTEVTKTRGKTYGKFKDNAGCTQDLVGVLDSYGLQDMTAVHREALHMIMHKVSRMVNGDAFHEDNCVDIAGYATLLLAHIQESEHERNR